MQKPDQPFGTVQDYLRIHHRVYADTPATLAPIDRAIIFVAVDLLCRQIGDRVPPIAEYCRAVNVGIGTVQKALKELADIGAVKLHARGHLGTMMVDRALGLLWRVARVPPIRFVVGPQENPEFLGLERGLQAALDELGIVAVFRRLRGSERRAGLVLGDEADCALLSRRAGELHAGSVQFFDLPPYTYYSKGAISVLRAHQSPASARLRVGIDLSSVDHQFLTRLLFDETRDDIEFVACPYPHAITALVTGHIDTAVWNRISLGLPIELLPIDRSPLPPAAEARVAEELSPARVIYSSRIPFLDNVLAALDLGLVTSEQDKTIREMNQRQRQLATYLTPDRSRAAVARQ